MVGWQHRLAGRKVLLPRCEVTISGTLLHPWTTACWCLIQWSRIWCAEVAPSPLVAGAAIASGMAQEMQRIDVGVGRFRHTCSSMGIVDVLGMYDTPLTACFRHPRRSAKYTAARLSPCLLVCLVVLMRVFLHMGQRDAGKPIQSAARQTTLV